MYCSGSTLIVLSDELRIVQKLSAPLQVDRADSTDASSATASADSEDLFIAVDTCHSDGKIAAVAGAVTHIYR